jgi:hypothetical protein
MLNTDFDSLLSFLFEPFPQIPAARHTCELLRVTSICRRTPVQNRCSREMQQLRTEVQVRTGNKTESPSLFFSHAVVQSPVAIGWQISALEILIEYREIYDTMLRATVA